MPDIRLSRPSGPRPWIWVGVLALAALLFWVGSHVLGDPTIREEDPQVGALTTVDRAPVLPLEAVPFETLTPLRQRDLGRLVRVRGVAESGIGRIDSIPAVWLRSRGGRRILLRFEPTPSAEALEEIRPGAEVALEGYLQKIAEAEFRVWTDTLGVNVPRPVPGRKFGDLPDPSFARIDSLFVKKYYISVRPEGLVAGEEAPDTLSR